MAEMNNPAVTIGTVPQVTATPPRVARALFASLAPGYERWARILSMGQDGRWRAHMVGAIAPRRGDVALDIAAGTGSITRLLQQGGATVTSLDQSAQMLGPAVSRGAVPRMYLRNHCDRTSRAPLST